LLAIVIRFCFAIFFHLPAIVIRVFFAHGCQSDEKQKFDLSDDDPTLFCLLARLAERKKIRLKQVTKRVQGDVVDVSNKKSN
jgi:hypothetical protein